jgi:hypothetical protein
MPKGKYSGQKLIKLVSRKMAANMRRMIAKVPVITLAMNKIAITTAISVLITLSAVPMFFFITSLI